MSCVRSNPILIPPVAPSPHQIGFALWEDRLRYPLRSHHVHHRGARSGAVQCHTAATLDMLSGIHFPQAYEADRRTYDQQNSLNES